MIRVDYKVSISGRSVDSSRDPKTELVALETFASMDSPVSGCRIAVYAPPAPLVRGQKVKLADDISIELTAGDSSGPMMKAEVQSIRSSFSLPHIAGATGMQKLASTRVNQVRSNQTLGQIARELANQAGVDRDNIEDSSTCPYFVVHESRNALAHIQQLASLEGIDAYFDSSNQLNLSTFQKTSAYHTFYFGIDILDLELLHVDASPAHVMFYGESPASNQGNDSWPWLVKDLSLFRGEVGDGVRLPTLGDRAPRTKESAVKSAKSKLDAIEDLRREGG